MGMTPSLEPKRDRRVLRALGLRGLLALALSLQPAWTLAASPMMSIIDGEAMVIDGAERHAGVVGLVVQPQAIVHTGERTAVVRIEWPDGVVADLGPSTRVLIEPPGFGPRDRRLPSLYLLEGWVKLSAGDAGAAPGLLGTTLDVQPVAGSVVVHARGQESFVFAEAGPVQVQDRRAAGPRASLKAGEVFAGPATGKPALSARPTPEQMQKVPKAFRDPLPRRAASLKGRKIEVRALAPPRYEDLRDWLQGEPALRRGFPGRFAALLSDSAFRAAVTAQLSRHAEWTPLIYPDKPPKPAGAASRTGP